MKTLLATTLLLSLSTFAQTTGEKNPYGGSENFEKMSVTEQKTVEIINPKFLSADSVRKISLSSSLDESSYDLVCKLFGLQKYVRNSKTVKFAKGNENIQLAELTTDSNQTTYTSGNFYLYSLECELSREQKTPELTHVSHNYKNKTINVDGSVTIKKPRMLFSGKNMKINLNSNLDKVCEFYGYEKAIDAVNICPKNTRSYGDSGKRTHVTVQDHITVNSGNPCDPDPIYEWIRGYRWSSHITELTCK